VNTLKEFTPTHDSYSDYELSGRQFGQYRRWATIALDANVLLGLYAYSKPTREEFFQILEAFKDRIWLPYQAAREFAKNRTTRIQEQVAFSEKIQKLLSNIAGDFTKAAKKKHPKVGRRLQYPFLSIEDIQRHLSTATDQIIEKLEAAEKEYNGFLVDDPVQKRLNQLTNGRIGTNLNESDLQQIYNNGRKRYDLQHPPGYCDAGKPGIEKYGDLVLWHQLIKRAEDTGHPIYFITDDMKEDWWQKGGEAVSGPRKELIDEMSELTSQRFLISTSADFYEWAGEYLGRRTRITAIEEARRSSLPSRWDLVTEMIRDIQRANERMLSVPYVPDFLAGLRETIAAAGANRALQLAALMEELSRSVKAAIFIPSIHPLFGTYSLEELQDVASEGDVDEEVDSD